MTEPASGQPELNPEPNRTLGLTRGGRMGVVVIAYLLVLLTATHWPGVEITGPVDRPDLWIHAGAYGLLAGLVLASGVFGSGRRGVWMAAAAAIAVSGLDEISQPWPPFHRHRALDDWLADVAGIVLVAAAWGMIRLRKRSA